MVNGVSVVICCHNSAKLLPTTLSYLQLQDTPGSLNWEVIVIDNASSDKTSQVAKNVWPLKAPAPLRVVEEPHLGLVNARLRGFAAAKYEIISFLDDDNWVSSDWVKVLYNLISENPQIGACGGLTKPAFEINPPWWFATFKSSYAAGPQHIKKGDITSDRGFVWGAGLSIRKMAWNKLSNEGFKPILMGRKGELLLAGEDSELCFAIRLAGFAIWYEPRLKLEHYVPAKRLKWAYLRQMHRGFGSSTVGHDPYYFALKQSPRSLKERILESWQWQAILSVYNLARYVRKLSPRRRQSLEGDPDILFIEHQIGRLLHLIQLRREYNLNIKRIRTASWNRISETIPFHNKSH